ncbi:acyl-[acyl-carrier-protein] thioesterase [Empedobacter stercoris]|uniref:acyl-[acyl-carrier-protein] thioesterase n=1 Tax=Empedobacter stercoris TaxID=1628248 RepID=UPI001CE082E2|nr:acyl-ACP thioesterase domain-containing protein [Empedobacter stercoris]MCA4781643.1 acyl-[acyl-carrier-protein] thioesterase [Empedobacter stercoris]
MPIAEDFQSIFIKNWEIYFSQCDPTGKMKLTEMANLFQLTASEHAIKGGLGFFDLQQYNQSWVMNRLRIEIDELPSWTDFVEVKTWIEVLKGAKSIRDFTIEKNGKKLIGASSLWAVFNTVKRRPDLLQIDSSHIERFPDLKPTKLENNVLTSNFEATEIIHYKVQFSDLDIVKHANNTKYLEWCLNTIDANIMLEHRIKAVDMNFLKELSLDDEIEIQKLETEKLIQFKIVNQEKINFVCQLELK